MKNWSGHIQWDPQKSFTPITEVEISNIVKDALHHNRKVRIIGSGHSFTPLSKTNDYLISLDKFQGVTAIDPIAKTVTVKAGTKLNDLNVLLDKHGLALENMGDIDVQSIAGATATGTHGTGTAFGNMCTQIIAIKFINGFGEIVQCSENNKPDLFKAAQLSLGALGIITELTLRCVPSFCLHLQVQKKTLEEVLRQIDVLNIENRNFEFYWFPNTPYVMTKELKLSDQPPEKHTFSDYIQEVILENYGFKVVCELSKLFPSLTRRLSRFSAALIDQHQKTRKSHQVFSTKRLVRFNEMEYNVPVEAYQEVKKELVHWVNKNNYDILFPIENRFVKKDDIYLSPAYERDSAYIAVHVYNKKDFRQYFEALEAIFQSYEGRPHWGKMHNCSYEKLAALYPKMETFRNLRIEQDPQNIFLSPYLRSLLEPSVSE